MVVIVTKDKNGNVVTTVEQLEEWLKKAESEAYIRGYSAGMRNAYGPSWYKTTTACPPWKVTLPNSIPGIDLSDIEITCDNKHPDDALDALRFGKDIDIQANVNGDEIILTALPKNDEERKILDNAINDMMSCGNNYVGKKGT